MGSLRDRRLEATIRLPQRSGVFGLNRLLDEQFDVSEFAKVEVTLSLKPRDGFLQLIVLTD